VDERDALSELWTGMYDITEELVAGAARDSPLASLTDQQRVQINVRRIELPWLGTHVLYVEEYPYDDPFERRRRVLERKKKALDAQIEAMKIALLAEEEETAALARESEERVNRLARANTRLLDSRTGAPNRKVRS